MNVTGSQTPKRWHVVDDTLLTFMPRRVADSRAGGTVELISQSGLDQSVWYLPQDDGQRSSTQVSLVVLNGDGNWDYFSSISTSIVEEDHDWPDGSGAADSKFTLEVVVRFLHKFDYGDSNYRSPLSLRSIESMLAQSFKGRRGSAIENAALAADYLHTQVHSKFIDTISHYTECLWAHADGLSNTTEFNPALYRQVVTRVSQARKELQIFHGIARAVAKDARSGISILGEQLNSLDALGASINLIAMYELAQATASNEKKLEQQRKQNETANLRLTSYVTLLAIPTLLFGYFGMNIFGDGEVWPSGPSNPTLTVLLSWLGILCVLGAPVTWIGLWIHTLLSKSRKRTDDRVQDI